APGPGFARNTGETTRDAGTLQPRRENASTITLTLPSAGIPKSRERKAPLTATGSIGRHAWAVTRMHRPELPPCSANKGADVLGVGFPLKTGTCQKPTISCQRAVGAAVAATTGNSSIAIATIRKRPATARWAQEVPMTRAKGLRSRMRLTSHVRF